MKFKTLIFIALLGSLFSCGNEPNNTAQTNTQNNTRAQSDGDAARYRELANLYVGKTVPYSQYDELGTPKTLTGTNNSQWVAYFPKGNFTIVTNKQTDIVKTVYIGKHEF